MIAQMFKMTRPAALAAVATAALLLAAPGLSAQTATPDKVVATVDGMPITEQDLDIAAEDVAEALSAQITDAQKRDYLVGYVSDLKLVARAAREAKLDANPDFERKVPSSRTSCFSTIISARKPRRPPRPRRCRSFRRDRSRAHARAGGARPPHPRREGRRGECDRGAAEGRRGLRKDRGGLVEGSRLRQGRRRSRLFHQGPDGSGIRGGCVQAEARAKSPRR